jgi:serine/threonine protein kinase/sugar lactone lactonase YvrE
MDSDLRHQLERLRRAALELAPHERDTFIETSCGGNEELRTALHAAITESELRTWTPPPQAPFESGNSEMRIDELETQELRPEQLQWPAGPLLGNYRVLSQLGKGAMGVVYLAHDTRLNRKIAIKMLPTEFTQEPSRLRRFEREARAASALNHPNVITVHEVGETNGIHFIATEFIEGNTLRRVLATERLELRDKISIASQIAAALDSAHRAKVIHRDIKPENIMVRPDGLVKVLDFGLARLTPERGTSDDHQRTSALAETHGGAWAGTPRYMSPEQIRGMELDSRTDIFSLGVVLYEMVAGRAPFGSEKPQDLFDEICHSQPPPLTGIKPPLPAELIAVIGSMLEKETERRAQSAGEIKTQLDALKHKIDREKEDRGFLHRHRVQLRLAAVMILLIGLAGLWWWISQRPAARPTPVITRLKNMRFNEAFASFSPDGRSIAYSANIDGEQRIWSRRLDRDEATPVTDGTSKDRSPIWSPTGETLAFVSDRAGRPGIWKIPLPGGQAELVKEMDVQKMVLTNWSKKRNAIYFEVSPNLYLLELDSGNVIALTDFEARNSARSFAVSPDESEVAFSALNKQKSRIWVMPVGSRTPHQLTSNTGEDDHSPNWLADGRTIVYGSRLNNIYELFTIDKNSRQTSQITFGDSNYQPLAVSSEARILAVSEKDNANIFYWDLATSAETGLTSDFGLQLFPDVSPDGRKILYHASDSSMQGQGAIMVREIDARGQPLAVVPAGRDARWGVDSDSLAYLEGPATGPQLWIARETGGRAQRITEGPVLLSGWTRPPRYRFLSGFDWSPDGKSIAYCSETAGRRGLHVVSIDGRNDSALVRNDDDEMKISSPRWSPDGKRIAYILEPLSYSRRGTRSVGVFEDGSATPVFERDEWFRLVGWSASGREVIVATGNQADASLPQPVKIFEVNPVTKVVSELKTIADVYLHSVKMSKDGRVAMTARQDGRDNILVGSIGGGAINRVTNNTDPTVYYSGLTWSPDGKRLFYSKQTNWSVATLIENFK